MGDNLYAPRDSNPKGFFEDPEINSINESILAATVGPRVRLWNIEMFKSRPLLGHRWIARVKLHPRLISNPGIEGRIKRIVCRSPYCIKDPRFSYTLPVWRPFLTNHVFLCIFREPEATAASMVKEVSDVRRDQGILNYISYRQAISVWACMYGNILEIHRHEGNWLFVHYNQILKGESLDKIENFTGASIDRSFPDFRFRRSMILRPTRQKTIRHMYFTLCALAGYETP